MSHAEGAECAEYFSRGAFFVHGICGERRSLQVAALLLASGVLVFLSTDDTDVHESLLSTDFTDDTVFCFAVPSQVQRAAICFIGAIC